MDRTLDHLDGQLGQTLAVVISKSGGTQKQETAWLKLNAYESWT